MTSLITNQIYEAMVQCAGDKLFSGTDADIVSILEKKRQKISDNRVEIKGERRAEYLQAFVKL